MEFPADLHLTHREQQVAELLLRGCTNAEIATTLKMKRRTVKGHFSRMFLCLGIQDGIKRVKLATLLYRRTQCRISMEAAPPPSANIA